MSRILSTVIFCASLTMGVTHALAETPLAFNEPSARCAAFAERDRFIVQWQSGETTVIRAPSKEALFENLPVKAGDRIAFIEPDYRVQLENEATSENLGPSFANWGQEKVKAPEAWKLAQGEGVIVAVIDSGVDVTHRQLKGRIAINPREIPKNSIDDDGNGYIDDYLGYDFSAHSPDVRDSVNSIHHGSAVAGVIAAEHADDPAGIKGIAPLAKILPVTFMDDRGAGNIANAIEAINYSVKRGAKIINVSWGAVICSQALQTTIARLESQGVLLVTASGNGDRSGVGVDLDRNALFPASFGFQGQITVGAIDDSNAMAGFSNFSRRLVHLTAPGVFIKSTVVDNGRANHGYAWMAGTSFAAPFVSGAAAVIWSYRPKATVAQVKQAILASVSPEKHLTMTGGYLNLQAALEKIAKLVSP